MLFVSPRVCVCLYSGSPTRHLRTAHSTALWLWHFNCCICFESFVHVATLGPVHPVVHPVVVHIAINATEHSFLVPPLSIIPLWHTKGRHRRRRKHAESQGEKIINIDIFFHALQERLTCSTHVVRESTAAAAIEFVSGMVYLFPSYPLPPRLTNRQSPLRNFPMYNILGTRWYVLPIPCPFGWPSYLKGIPSEGVPFGACNAF